MTHNVVHLFSTPIKTSKIFSLNNSQYYSLSRKQISEYKLVITQTGCFSRKFPGVYK